MSRMHFCIASYNSKWQAAPGIMLLSEDVISLPLVLSVANGDGNIPTCAGYLTVHSNKIYYTSAR